jgi:Arc/MetJ-type ribon-helix-helix transcriptional regulator
MTMRKVTVSLPDEVADGVQAAVESGGAASFSAFVAEATKARLDRETSLARYRDFTGGPHCGELRQRAERAVGLGQGADAAASAGSAPVDAGDFGSEGLHRTRRAS